MRTEVEVMPSLSERRALYAERYGVPTPVATPVEPSVVPERAFVMTAASGRTVITAPLREVAATNAGFTYLRGRMVGADQPNGNGAFWSSADLELGQATVAGGPVNWLHDETRIVGSLLDGQFTRETASGPHIVSTMAIWRFLFPAEAALIERAASEGQLMQSMECVAREVACMNSPDGTLSGCGEAFSYADYNEGKTCEHLRERSSMRRFVDPIFLGTAIIIPPVKPADPHASVEVVRQAAQAVEEANFHMDGVSLIQAQGLAATILQWANRS